LYATVSQTYGHFSTLLINDPLNQLFQMSLVFYTLQEEEARGERLLHVRDTATERELVMTLTTSVKTLDRFYYDKLLVLSMNRGFMFFLWLPTFEEFLERRTNFSIFLGQYKPVDRVDSTLTSAFCWYEEQQPKEDAQELSVLDLRKLHRLLDLPHPYQFNYKEAVAAGLLGEMDEAVQRAAARLEMLEKTGQRDDFGDESSRRIDMMRLQSVVANATLITRVTPDIETALAKAGIEKRSASILFDNIMYKLWLGVAPQTTRDVKSLPVVEILTLAPTSSNAVERDSMLYMLSSYVIDTVASPLRMYLLFTLYQQDNKSLIFRMTSVEKLGYVMEISRDVQRMALRFVDLGSRLFYVQWLEKHTKTGVIKLRTTPVLKFGGQGPDLKIQQPGELFNNSVVLDRFRQHGYYLLYYAREESNKAMTFLYARPEPLSVQRMRFFVVQVSEDRKNHFYGEITLDYAVPLDQLVAIVPPQGQFEADEQVLFVLKQAGDQPGYIKIYKKEALRPDNCYDISGSVGITQEHCHVCHRTPEDLQYDVERQCYYCDDLCQVLDYTFHDGDEPIVT
jgi:hypothetical protein